MSALSFDEVRAEVFNGRLIAANTFDERQLGSSVYDLRLSPTNLLVYESGITTPKQWTYGKSIGAAVILPPNSVAAITTVERICMPWTFSGTLGNAFHLAHKGVWLFPGLFVDPGFGMRLRQDSAEYECGDGEPLVLLLVNMGKEAVPLAANQTIARLQFARINEPSKKQPKSSSATFKELFLDSPPQEIGLGFYLQTARASDLAETREIVNRLSTQIVDIKREYEVLNSTVTSVHKGTTQLVYFGVFIISSAIFGASLSVLWQISNKADPIAAVLAIVGAVLCTLVFLRFGQKYSGRP
jgi:deoxycytidine triphosphate deaminase